MFKKNIFIVLTQINSENGESLNPGIPSGYGDEEKLGSGKIHVIGVGNGGHIPRTFLSSL